MTSKELDERIDAVSDHGYYAKEVKQLIRDCIEAVAPKMQDPDTTATWYEYQLEANTKELLG